MNLSKQFTLEQFEFSQTALRLNIPNHMGSNERNNAKLLCENVLEPIYNKIYKFNISSGFRCKELNKKIGGSEKSQHCEGKAVDIVPIKASLFDFLDEVRHSKIPFDQLILEFNSWIHLSYNENHNRHHVLKASKFKDEIIYIQL